MTILYDAFKESEGADEGIRGFSAFVEHNGKRILFDTGNDAAIFERNVKALGVDLTKLDFVVTPHRHADHTTGLRVCAESESERYGLCARGWGMDLVTSTSEDVFAGG